MSSEGLAAVEGLASARASTEAATALPPYAPSWVDRVMARVERLPGPTWLAYLVLLCLSLFLAAAEGWVSGLTNFPAVDPVQTGFGIFFTTPLAVMHYLKNVAGDAWDRFRPATDLDEASAARCRYELTVTPARGAIVITVIGYVSNLAWYISDPVGTGIQGRSAAFVAIREVVEGFISAVLLILIYQVIRQLRIVSRLHSAVARVDLFQPASLHALSRLTSRSALGIVFLAVFIDLPYPGTESLWVPTTLIFAIPMLLLALVAFALPLRGLHARLADEKARMSAAATSRLDRTVQAIHALVDDETANTGDRERSKTAQVRLDALSKAQGSLIQERTIIEELSTWPWDTSTLRAVVSAVALPIGLFVLTQLIGRLI